MEYAVYFALAIAILAIRGAFARIRQPKIWK